MPIPHTEDKGSFPRSLVCISYSSYYVSVALQYCEVDVFIIYVNFSVGSSGTPVTKARVRTSSGLIRNILFTRISDILFVRLLHNNRIY